MNRVHGVVPEARSMFCICPFYHKLAMTFEDLLRSYLVKQFQDNLNKLIVCHTDPLKGNHIGAKVSSVEASFQEHIQDYLNQNPFSKYK